MTSTSAPLARLSEATMDNQDLEANLEPRSSSPSIDRPSVEKPNVPEAPPANEYQIDWDGPEDPGNPLNWPRSKKIYTTIVLSLTCLVCTFASSVFAVGQQEAALDFGVSNEVMTLGTALFLCGYALGPIIFAPLSEQFGRKIPLLMGYFLFAVFTISSATAKDIQTLMLTRFFAGVAGSSPLVLVGAIFNDYWHANVRGIAICLFASAVFVGPSVAPVIGGFIVQSYLGWRWTLYLTSIMAFFMLFLATILYEESFGNTILARRAAEKRAATGNFAWHHKSELKPFRISQLVTVYLSRPLVMIYKEPIVGLLTLYVAFVYGILYLMLEAVPIAFIYGHGWSLAISQLPFISLIVGVLIGAAIIIAFNPLYKRLSIQAGGRPVPRGRLPPMIIGGFVFPIGFFVFSWSADINHGKVFWLVPCIGLALIGCGILLIFLQSLNYLIDVYLMYAASALAASTVVRSILAGGLAMVAEYMFVNMHVKWAGTLLGLIALLLAPIPMLFWRYDERLQKTVHFSPNK